MADTEIGGLIVRMKADLSDYDKKLAQMETQTVKTSDKVTAAFKGMTTVMAVVGTSIGSFAASAVNSAMKWGNAVDDLSDKTGMAAEKASELLVYAKRVGIGAEEAGMMFARFGRTIYNSADAMAKAKAEGKNSDDVLSRLKISAIDSNGAMRDTADIFQEVKEKLSSMQDGWQKTAIEMELFGRSGTEMHDMLNMTKEEMQAVKEKAEAMGLILNNEQSSGWEKFKRDLEGAKGTLTAVGGVIANEMRPKLQELLGEIQSATKAYVNMDSKQRETVNSLLSFIAEVGVATTAVKGLEWAIGRSLGPWGLFAVAIWESVSALRALKTENGTVREAYVWDGPNHGHGIKIRDLDTEHGGSSRWEDYNKKYPTVPTTSTDTFLGGGGSSDSGSSGGAEQQKTALQAYQEEFQKAQQILQNSLELNQTTAQEYITYLYNQLKYVKDINVGKDEEADKTLLLQSIQKDIQSQQRQISQDEIQAASKKVQLGQMTIEQYRQVLEKQLLLAKNDKDRLALAVQIYQENQKLIDQANKKVDSQSELDKIALDSNQERSRHDLVMSQTSGNLRTQDIFANLQVEYDQAKKNIADRQKLEDDALQKKIDNSAADLEKQKEFTDQKLKLDEKYKHEREKIDNFYYEKVASQQQKIINANNDMITSLITGTKSGHDILEDMWSDFVKQVVAKMFSLKTSLNVFEQILGPLVGLNKSSSSSTAITVTASDMINGKTNWFAGGGEVRGEGTDTSDSIFSKLSNGEYVIKASSVRAYGKDFFDMLNAGAMPRFSDGGLVDASALVPTYTGSIIPNSAITSGQALQNQTNSAIGGNPKINVNIINNSGQQIEQSQVDTRFDSKMRAFVVNVTLDTVTRNVGGMRDIIKGVR